MMRKGERTMFIIKYTNRNGKIIERHFNAWSDVKKWSTILDKRISEGRCGGYIISRV